MSASVATSVATSAPSRATASARPVGTGPTEPPVPPSTSLSGRFGSWLAVPTIVVLLNAVAFAIVRPDVNDLWAARARAAGARNGVGLTYWFDWFGGGTTPGSYSVLTPQLSALIGTEVLCALSAVAVVVVGTWAVRRTPHPLAAAWMVAFAAVANLWSGRVPFLFGAAIGIGAIIALRSRRRALSVGLTVLSVFASPISGAFILMGLSGTFITTRTKDWRPAIAWVAGAAVVAMVTVAAVFGSAGPQPFHLGLLLELLGFFVLFWLARPPDHIRTTILWSGAAALVLFAVPTAMGSNFARFAWFVLPVVVLATTRLRPIVAFLLVLPALYTGAYGTVTDLLNAARPVSSVGYYDSLARRLDTIGDLRGYRVEVVNHGAHAGYDALLEHAMLARGWETQEDAALNSALEKNPLDAVTYKLWLDNNAVGYVALPANPVGRWPEYDLVKSRTPSYLQPIWHTRDWQLYRVADPTPIVAAPARIVGHTSSTLDVSVPCACTTSIRVYWSKFLGARLLPPGGQPDAATDRPEITAKIADDGAQWTTVTTPRPGTYRLSGSLKGLLR